MSLVVPYGARTDAGRLVIGGTHYNFDVFTDAYLLRHLRSYGFEDVCRPLQVGQFFSVYIEVINQGVIVANVIDVSYVCNPEEVHGVERRGKLARESEIQVILARKKFVCFFVHIGKFVFGEENMGYIVFSRKRGSPRRFR